MLVEGLRKAGRKPTREKLITALESLRPFDVGGLKVTHTDSSYTGLEFVDLSIIGADGQFKRWHEINPRMRVNFATTQEAPFWKVFARLRGAVSTP